ncbi:MAG: ABC transporter substrate-binding protein [bacterium]
MKPSLIKIYSKGIICFVLIGAILSCGGCGRKQGVDKFSKGKHFPELRILYDTSDENKKIATIVSKMWQTELGIDVKLENVDVGILYERTDALDYEIVRSNWFGDYEDPTTFLNTWAKNSPHNQTGWSSEEYDSLMKAAAAERDGRKRMRILSDAEDILINKEVPVIPIYFGVRQSLVKTYVKEILSNAYQFHPLKYVYLNKDGVILPPEEQILRFNQSWKPGNLDHTVVVSPLQFDITLELFEGLVQNDHETLEPIPAIASHWDISPEQTAYTFYLRKDVKWSNGDPVTAHDFLYSWKRVLEPKTGSNYAEILFFIKNAEDYHDGKIKDFNEVGLHVIDDYTLSVFLEHATPFWLNIVAFNPLFPVNRKCVEEYGAKWTAPENIVVNGPFLLKEYSDSGDIMMVKNPDYYEADGVKLQKIVIRIMDRDTAALNKFKDGEIDWLRSVPVSHAYRAKKWPEVRIDNNFSTYHFKLNVTRPPLNDVRVRKALNLAIDRNAICEFTLRGGQRPAYTFVPPGVDSYKPPAGPEYDPDKARKLLNEAGYKINMTWIGSVLHKKGGRMPKGHSEFPEAKLKLQGHKN